MRICYGWAKTPLRLSFERRYYPEDLMRMVTPFISIYSTANPLFRVPLWVQLDEQYVRLETAQELSLACQLASIYHNGPNCRAPHDDGWNAETIAMETEAELRMLSPDQCDPGTDADIAEGQTDDAASDYIKVESVQEVP